MWVIKQQGMYLWAMYTSGGVCTPVFHHLPNAFRFPDEQTAQAVLKFLNRDNLEVVCIE